MASVGNSTSGPDVHDRLVGIGRSWHVYVFFGVVCVVVGILVLVWPQHTLTGLAVLFGLELIVSGLFHLLAAVALPDAGPGSRALMAILGLLGLVIGLYALRHIDIAVSILALPLAIYWIIDGVVRIFAAIDYPILPGQALRIVVGVLAITAGTDPAYLAPSHPAGLGRDPRGVAADVRGLADLHRGRHPRWCGGWLSASDPGRLYAGLGDQPSGVHGRVEGLIVALVLVGVGGGELGDGPIESIALAEVGGDRDPIAPAGMRPG